jgi:hypothetical protein
MITSTLANQSHEGAEVDQHRPQDTAKIVCETVVCCFFLSSATLSLRVRDSHAEEQSEVRTVWSTVYD